MADIRSLIKMQHHFKYIVILNIASFRKALFRSNPKNETNPNWKDYRYFALRYFFLSSLQNCNKSLFLVQ